MSISKLVLANLCKETVRNILVIVTCDMEFMIVILCWVVTHNQHC